MPSLRTWASSSRSKGSLCSGGKRSMAAACWLASSRDLMANSSSRTRGNSIGRDHFHSQTRCAMLRLCVLWVLVAGLATPEPAAGTGSHASSLQARPYSSAAIWSIDEHQPELEVWCGRPVFELSPERSSEDMGCIARAMRETGASPGAVRFFETTKMFLRAFQPLGTVDLGTASAPWFNMGRGNLFFLNGSPEAVSIFDVTPSA